MDDFWKGITALVAVVAAYLAWNQVRIAREKLKLDLFEKRFAVFAGTRRMLSLALQNANLTLQELFEFRAAIGERHFLYGDDVRTYLEEMDRQAVALHTYAEAVRQGGGGPQRQQHVERMHAALEYLTAQLPELAPRFAPYLKFEGSITVSQEGTSGRSDTLSDALRGHLIVVHAGAIGLLVTLATDWAGRGTDPLWIVWPSVCFAAGLLAVFVGILLAQFRALRRAKQPSRTFPWYAWGITWNGLSLAALLAGAIATFITVASLPAVTRF